MMMGGHGEIRRTSSPNREAEVPRFMPWVCWGTTQRLLGLERSRMLGRLFILNL